MAGGRRWTEQELDLARDFRSYAGYRQACSNAQIVPRPNRAWASKRNEMGWANEGEFAPVDNEPKIMHGGPDAPALSDTPTLDEFIEEIERQQTFKRRTTSSRHETNLGIDTDEPICLVGVGDLHLGAGDVSVTALRELIRDLETPGVHIGYLGDMIQLALGFHGVMEAFSNALTPEQQYMMAEEFLERFAHKTAFGVWGNHDAREERQLGTSRIGRMFAERAISYSSGIAHFDFRVGDQTYQIAATHRFQGRSQYSPTFGHQKYTKWHGHNRDLLFAGDSHQPGIAYWWQGDPPTMRVAINCGSVQTDSTYGKRYFSLHTNPVYPCVALWPNEKRMLAFPSVKDWIEARSTLGV